MRTFIVVIIVALLSSCANIPRVRNEATKTLDNPECTSIVEGLLLSDTLYSAKPPLLVLKKAYNTSRYLRGGIISISDSGVVFQRVKDGLYTPDPKFYAFRDVECLIDSNNHICWGEWKGKEKAFWNLELICQNVDSVEAEPFTLVFEANKAASYCIAPGSYRVVLLRFRGFDDFLDGSDSLCCTTFTVKAHSVNYLGTMHTKYTWALDTDFVVVPITVLHRPGMNSIAPFPGGAIGGVLQYLADREKAEKEREESPFHFLRVIVDSTYNPLSKTGLPINLSPIDVHGLQ